MSEHKPTGPILLTGGTGFVGGHLRSALQMTPVILLGRKKPALLANEQWTHVDMANPIAPEKLANGEVLCHLAYSMADGRKNVTYNQHLLDAVNACRSVKRVILLSSTSVYGASALPVVGEESRCNPVGEYPETKLACEMLWREGLREECLLTVLRPSEVIGPGGKGLQTLIRDALRRPVVGAIKRGVLYHRPLNYVAVSNLVAAIRFCLDHRQASAREVYIVSDDHYHENKSYATMQDTVRYISGRRPLPSLVVPRWVMHMLGKGTGRPLLGVRRVLSSQKIHDAGFEDVISLRDEVRRVVQDVEKRARSFVVRSRE